ncbi:MAG TPA: hydrolase [Myxococcales bacterium]|jgi:nicotinamidase-related amidase
MPSEQDLALDRKNALLLVVDVQERLFKAMPQDGQAPLLKNLDILVKAARTLKLPVVTSEQYPKGLGPTVPSLRENLPAAPLEKLEFSCAGNPAIAEAIRSSGRRQIVVAGMETHVCVYQTVRDLVGRGFSVFVPADAVISRTPDNKASGLALCQRAGAVLTSTEASVFDLLGAAGTPEFKEISPLLK